MLNAVMSRMEQAGYVRFQVNQRNILVYCKKNVAIILVDYRDPNNAIVNRALIQATYRAIYQYFEEQGIPQGEIMTLVATYSEFLAKDLVDSTMNYWVIDVYQEQIIIPVGQEMEFHQLYNILDGRYEGKSIARKSTKQKIIARIFLINNLIVLINILVYIYLEKNGSTLDTLYMLDHGGFYWPYVILDGEWYRIITYMFIHFGFSHMFNNMLVLFFLGDNLERAVGIRKFLMIYFGSGICAVAASGLVAFLQNHDVVTGGASGAIFGVVGALLYVVARNHGKLEDLSTTRLVLFVGLSLYSGFTSVGVDNAAHVGGFLAGVILGACLYRKNVLN